MPQRSSMLACRKTRRYSKPLSMLTPLVMSICSFCRSIPNGTSFVPSLASRFYFNSVGLKRTPTVNLPQQIRCCSGWIVGYSEVEWVRQTGSEGLHFCRPRVLPLNQNEFAGSTHEVC